MITCLSINNPAARIASADWEGGLSRLAVKILQDGDKKVYDALCSKLERVVLIDYSQSDSR